jgi:hypothetical protein
MAFALCSKGRRTTAAQRCFLCLAVAGLALFANGCTTTYNNNWWNHCNNECCVDSLFTAWRDHVWAKRAFHRCYPVCGHLHARHFRRGFMAGYGAVCGGEDPYLPAVAPEEYWGYSYQSAEGSQMVGAWFEGYPEGVKAANQDGAGAYRNLQISSSMDELMEPNSDPWAPYMTPEGGDQPPVISGQGTEMPALPEPVSTEQVIEPSASHDVQMPGAMARSAESRSLSHANVPLSSGRPTMLWGAIR